MSDTEINGIRNYYFETLTPQFESYYNAPVLNYMGNLDLRNLALQCAGSQYHMRDKLKRIKGNGFDRVYVASLCAYYDLVGDVFNASKHENLNRKEKLIKDDSAIMDGMFASRFEDQQGKYTVNQSAIFIDPIKGKNVDLLLACVNVCNFWNRFLFDENIIEEPIYYRYKGEDSSSRSDASHYSWELDVRVSVNKGVQTKFFTTTVRSFDYQTGKFRYSD